MSPQELLSQSSDGEDSASPLRIVGIGASTQSIEALQQFFAHVPSHSGVAFVIILQLAPDDDRHAIDALQQMIKLSVTQVTSTVPIVVDHVYIIPPDQYVSITDGTLWMHAFSEEPRQRAPIDIFFRALAEAHGVNAAAIVLAGSGADGAIGVQRIKEQGGVVFVQDPQEATIDAMPQNALATGLVDFVLPVADMPAQLINYWNSAATVQLPSPELPSPTLDNLALREVFSLLRVTTGHDFSRYKRATVLRRIGRRMQVTRVTNLQAYLNVLRAQPNEVQALLRDLLISVTNFFRDAAAWQACEAIIPQLFADKTPDDQVRVWVAGCATGEEAYTVAILLQEYALTLDQAPAIQVFATDIDLDAINVARQGRYHDTIMADVSPERLQRFFTLDQGHYNVKKEIRDMVLFAPHNLLRDPPFSRLDMATCRNVLIYLNRDVQDQVLQLFHFVLHPNSYLLLGASESIDGLSQLFTAVDKTQRLFQRRAAPMSVPTPMPTLPLAGPSRQPLLRQPARSTNEAHSLGELHTQLLAQYMPPSVIVNEDYDIMYLSRGAGRFLAFAEGEPSHNLLRVIHPDLRLDLRAALFAIMHDAHSTEVRRARVVWPDAMRLVDMTVQRIMEPAWAQGYILIVFNDLMDAAANESNATNDAEPIVQHLEDELLRTKDQLRATIEQYETAVEEYKATNEELQAINEELRAASEELETGREELQSVNEELVTVNQELKWKVDEVTQSNNDLQNLMASTEIGTLFVDRELRIRRYTPSVQTIFNMIPSDINRPLAHVTHHLEYDQELMQSDMARVLATLEKREREIRSTNGRWYMVRILPYRTIDDKIDGLTMMFIDITDRRESENALRISEYYLRMLVESIQEYAIFTLDPHGIIVSWSPASERLLGYSEDEAIGQPLDIIFTPEDRAQGVPASEMQLADTLGRAQDDRWHMRRDGTRFFASGVMAPLRDMQGELRGFVKVSRDMTQQRETEEALEQARATLEQRVEERTSQLAVINTRLQSEIQERMRSDAARLDVLRQLVTSQEDERHRIARELHDEFGQQLSALRLGLARIETSQPDDLATLLQQLQKIAAELDKDVDRLAIGLRPIALDDLGLRAAMQQHVEEWGELSGISAEFQAAGIDGDHLPSEIEIVLYRVMQEALTNVTKHAAAQHVSVILERRPQQVRLVIEDDGDGFDPAAVRDLPDSRRRLGLLGMRERIGLIDGAMTIESTPGRGTTIFVRIPLPEAKEAVDA